jgi:hypothetical protein
MRWSFVLPYAASSALAGAMSLLAPEPSLAQSRPASSAPEGASPSSEDDSARARARYDAGTLSFAQGRFVEAALEFEAAASLKPNSVALYTAALSWERANVPERAADDYGRALTIGGLPGDSSSSAERRLHALEAVLGTLVVDGPSDRQVQLDADSEVPAPAKLHAPAGVHTLTVRSAGRAIIRVPVVLRAAFTTRMDLPLAAPPPATATTGAPAAAFAPTPARPSMDTGAAVGWVAVGAGTAILLSGVLLRVEATDSASVYNQNQNLDPALRDRATNLQSWANAAWIAGGTLLPVGLALLLWPRPAAAAAHPVAASRPIDSWLNGRF